MVTVILSCFQVTQKAFKPRGQSLLQAQGAEVQRVMLTLQHIQLAPGSRIMATINNTLPLTFHNSSMLLLLKEKANEKAT